MKTFTIFTEDENGVWRYRGYFDAYVATVTPNLTGTPAGNRVVGYNEHGSSSVSLWFDSAVRIEDYSRKKS